jgi:hypothetical protein
VYKCKRDENSFIDYEIALIENVKTVPELNNNGLPNVSLLIQTSQRQLKLIAPNMDKHEAWFEVITYNCHIGHCFNPLCRLSHILLLVMIMDHHLVLVY